MYRSKDFFLMDVNDINGKSIGYIKDLLVDFNQGRVIGFALSCYKFLQNNVSVFVEDIISFNSDMIVGKINKDKKLELSQIKNMDIINVYGQIIGITEELLFDKNSFKINGFIVSMGFFRDFTGGKKIILINEVIIGEESILFYGCYNKINFFTVPHKLFMEVNK